MRILAIDPASINTGYAVMEAPSTVIDAGVCRADQKKRPSIRIYGICEELFDLCVEHDTDRVVIETTTGKTSGHNKSGAGLAVYGMAVGAITFYFQRLCEIENVIEIRENVWTGGVPKAKRRMRLATLLPQLSKEILAENNHDMADAIGLGVWYFNHERMIEAGTIDI